MPIRVLVCCATSAVTSTIMKENIESMCKKEGLNVEVYKCIGAEIPAKIELLRPCVLITTLAVQRDYGIPVLSGIPYLTGIGKDALNQQVLDIVREKAKETN